MRHNVPTDSFLNPQPKAREKDSVAGEQHAKKKQNCIFYIYEAERLSPVDPGISRGVADLYPSRGYTHPVTRTIEVSHGSLKMRVLFAFSKSQLQFVYEVLCFFVNILTQHSTARILSPQHR